MAHQAGAATLLELTRHMAFAAPAATVWAIAGDFGGIGHWIDVIDTVTLTHGGHNAPGTVRHLTIKGGGTIDEELLAWDAGTRSLRYRIVQGVLPVSDYVSDFRVDADGADRSTVTWTGRFKRKDTGAHPAKGADDAAATAAIAGVYDGGLAGLRRATERH